MVIRNLREALGRLQDEISRVELVDDGLRGILDEIKGDVEQLLDMADDEIRGDHSIKNHIDDAIENFEVSHPRLTELMAQVTYALSKVGI